MASSRSGYNVLYKRLIGQIQDEWLESDQNIDMWLGDLEKKLTESDCRILITHWVYKRLQSADYKKIKI